MCIVCFVSLFLFVLMLLWGFLVLGGGGGGGGGGIWDMHTLHFILSDIVVNCRMCVCVCISADSLFHKCFCMFLACTMKPKGGGGGGREHSKSV